jgi:hypothetical protein
MSARTRSGTNEQALAEAALKVTMGLITSHDELTAALTKIFVSDKEFEEIFANARVTKADFARYLLRELEEQSSTNQSEQEWVNSDPQQITLEHILPKTWNQAGWTSFTEDQHAEYRHRIGNLCLLKRSENNSMPNDNFDEKKTIYAESSYVTTTEIADYGIWSPEAVEQRQKKLAKVALKKWSGT